MEVRVQQDPQPVSTAPNSRVVEFDFERLEFLKEGDHGQCVLCGLTFELRRDRR